MHVEVGNLAAQWDAVNAALLAGQFVELGLAGHPARIVLSLYDGNFDAVVDGPSGFAETPV